MSPNFPKFERVLNSAENSKRFLELNLLVLAKFHTVSSHKGLFTRPISPHDFANS